MQNAIERFYYSGKDLMDGKWEEIIKNSDTEAIQKAREISSLKRDIIMMSKKSEDLELRERILEILG